MNITYNELCLGIYVECVINFFSITSKGFLFSIIYKQVINTFWTVIAICE